MAIDLHVLRAFCEEIAKTAAGAPTRGNFMMASEVPPFRAPRLDRAIQKEGDFEAPIYGPGDFKQVNILKKRASALGAVTQAATAAKKIGVPPPRSPAMGIGVKDIAKPVGKGFGSGIPGAFAKTLGHSGPVDLATNHVGS